METDNIIKTRIEKVLPILNEQQRRVYLGAEARSIGRGGTSKIARLSSVTRRTIAKGIKESPVIDGGMSKNRVRKDGGGRKRIIEHQPELLKAIEDFIAPHTMGDPMNPLLWTSKSIRKITAELLVLKFKVSHEVVRQCLMNMGYSLQANRKTKEGGDSPDRDAQFEYINALTKEFIACHEPVISVDCKKKELIGEYKNNGQEWTTIKNPIPVNVYDFINKTNGKASPYGLYDSQYNRGWVNIGVSSDTAEFAVATIRDWWYQEGNMLYTSATRLYINADGGGSNGSRNNLWKAELQRFSNDSGLSISVSHFPPGTSKWNKIEHRLFAYISKNWRAKPLTSLLVMLNLIGATTTTTGLTIKANLDEKIYLTGIKVTEEEKKKLNINRSDFHGEWNYTISPNL
jgi:hypothetical protein